MFDVGRGWVLWSVVKSVVLRVPSVDKIEGFVGFSQHWRLPRLSLQTSRRGWTIITMHCVM